MSWGGVLTDAGQALLDQWGAGGHTLTIDRAEVGSGLTEAANMRAATALASYVAAASIVGKEAISGGTKIKVQVSPVNTAFSATEIGIWAHIDSEASVLMALHQDEDGGASIPAKSDNPDFVFILNCIHSISNTDELTITVDPNAYVSMAVYEAAINALEDAKLNKTGDSKDNVVSFTSSDTASPTAWDSSMTVMGSGQKHSTYLGLISRALKNLRFLKTRVDDTKESKVVFTSSDTTDSSVTRNTGWSTVTPLASNITHANLFSRISLMMKNVRYLYKLIGTTNIASLSTDGTVTGALNKLNTDITTVVNTYTPVIYWGFDRVDNQADVEEVTFIFYKIGRILLISGRFILKSVNVTNVALRITLPSDFSYVSQSAPGCYGTFVPAQKAELDYCIRLDTAERALVITYGAQGSYSASVLTTGYHALFAAVALQ